MILEVSQMTSTIIQYTEEQVKNMSDKELLDTILGLSKKSLWITRKLDSIPELKNELFNRTKFLELKNPNVELSARLYCLENNIHENPRCSNPNCHREDNYVSWNRKKREFRPYCSNKCMTSSESVKEKRIQTCLEKYNETSPMKSDVVKKKVKETCIRTFGVGCALQSPVVREKIRNTWNDKYPDGIPMHSESVLMKIKETKKLKYGDENYNNREKANATMDKLYGTSIPFNVPEFKEKAINTCIEKYGGIGLQSEIIREKQENTMISRHGVKHALEKKEFMEKAMNTTFEHHGVYHPSQSREIMDKIIATTKENYGVEHPNQSSEIMERVKQTNRDKFGYDYASQSKNVKEKINQTNLNIYGYEWSFQSDIVKEKIRETNVSKYGVPSYSQTSEFHKKCHKKYTNEKYPDMTFGSGWEFKVYDFLIEHNIEFEYQPSISFEYEYDGRTWTYHPDFKIGEKIFEVKGDHFFRINESNGKEEMYCPYRYNDWSDEHYIWMCGKYESKHQCMLNHGVIILRDKDIKNISVELFN